MKRPIMPKPKYIATLGEVESLYKHAYRELMKTLGPDFIPTNEKSLYIRGFASAGVGFNQPDEMKTAFRLLALLGAMTLTPKPFKAWLDAAYSRLDAVEQAKLNNLGG